MGDFAKGGYVPGTGTPGPLLFVYQHDLLDPAEHQGHPTTWDGWDILCRRYVVEHLVKADGHCSICGAHIVDVEAYLAEVHQKKPSLLRRIINIIIK